MQVGDPAKDLQRSTCYLFFAHLSRHDNRKKVERRVFHNFVPFAFLLNNIHSLDDVAMVQRGPDTELCCDFLVVLALALVRMSISELLDCKGHAVTLALHEPHRSTRTRAQDFPKFSISAFYPVIISKWDGY